MENVSFITIKFWFSQELASCCHSARLMLIGMATFARSGYLYKKCYKSIKINIFPGDSVSDADIDLWANELIAAGLIKEVENHKELGNCWELTSLTRHLLIISVPSDLYHLATDLNNRILEVQMDN